MRLRPFDVEDLLKIDPQPSQAGVLDARQRERILSESVKRGPCWTYPDGDRIVAIGGLGMVHDTWATAWTILAADIGWHMVGLTRAVRSVLHTAAVELGPDGRIDMHVDPQSLDSIRWAAMLGFVGPEAWLERAMPGCSRALTIWRYDPQEAGRG